MRCYHPLVCLMALTLLAAPAWANSGTPLMWLEALHLFYANILIAMFEAWVLKKRFGLGNSPVGWMILANYVSAVAGFGLIALGYGLGYIMGAWFLYLGLPFLLAMFLLAFALTVATEWPFCRFIARDTPQRNRTAWKMSLTAQVASYAILLPLYLLAAPISLLYHVRPLAQVSRTPLATVYYLARDGDVWRVRTDGTGREKVMAAGAKGLNDRLALVPRGKSGPADLVLVKSTSSPKNPDNKVLRAELALDGTFARRSKPAIEEPDSWQNHGTLYMAPARAVTWEATAGFWTGEGVTVSTGHAKWQDTDGDGNDDIRVEEPGYQSYKLALETPFLNAPCRNVTVLPNDMAVFQVGRAIVLLDMPARRCAPLADGRGPVVVLTERVPSTKAQ